MGKALVKPPDVVVRRLHSEVRREWERRTLTRYGSGVTVATLLKDIRQPSLADAWSHLASRPFAAAGLGMDAHELDAVEDGEVARVLARADMVLAGCVRILGVDIAAVERPIDWHRDYLTGFRWDRRCYTDLEYGTVTCGGDVKIPWELSRLQWCLPAAQAYALTRDERYAEAVREILRDWIDANPYGVGVNWACTMEVALRVLTWSFLFHALHASSAWEEPRFRESFLRVLYEHGLFTERHLEYSDVNGNHYTADAAGLVFAGLFFGGTRRSHRWANLGWRILREELPRQVLADGVDFEMSTAYHRLVLELFLLPALYRRAAALELPVSYSDRLVRMANFVSAYSGPRGVVPLWGDADDARALPLGTQPFNDHRYLIGCVAVATDSTALGNAFGGSRSEIAWWFGPGAARKLPRAGDASGAGTSAAFPEGGCYIMRRGANHIFIDCGPVGLAGRGGHGHNDCLAFSAVLDGVALFTDCGSFVYTASHVERNRFRSTAYHNTPQVDGEEINRFFQPDQLWILRNDAAPRVDKWVVAPEHDVFVGRHTGYGRLQDPVEPVRTIVFDKITPALLIHDDFAAAALHEFRVPLHLSPPVHATLLASGSVRLATDGAEFLLSWWGGGWTAKLAPARVSPSYGVVEPASQLVWETRSRTTSLTVYVARTDAGVNSARQAALLLKRAGINALGDSPPID